MTQKFYFLAHNPKNWKWDLRWIHLYTHVHCSIFHNSPEVEATQVPINRWTGSKMRLKHTVSCYSALKRKEQQANGKGKSWNKKEGSSDARYRLDEPWNQSLGLRRRKDVSTNDGDACTDRWGRLSCLSLLFSGTLHSDGCIFPFLLSFSFSSFLSCL